MREPLERAPLTAEEGEALDTLYRIIRDVRVRTRAHIILLVAEQQLPATALARIMRLDDQTVRNWFKQWIAEGFEGLKDRPMPERPAKVTKAYQEQLLMEVRRRPRALDPCWSISARQRYSLEEEFYRRDGMEILYQRGTALDVHKFIWYLIGEANTELTVLECCAHHL